jgi:hypothetical protein
MKVKRGGEFNVPAIKNKTKKNSWWSKPPYHNNKQTKKEK